MADTSERMTWDRLLSSARLRHGAVTPSSEPRNEFERDYDRILFSEPFRRLMDKTQVFPMPENDHVHNRLIHSLEVASVGRSMGRLVGREMQPDRSGVLGDVVASACLMHDLGNPPFGHAGEDAIASWFAQDAHAELLADLSPAERRDLIEFEGNAQSFRTVARLSMYGEDGGMRLTHAVLAAAAKYPCSSTSTAHKKFNFFVNDAPLFAELAEGVGLLPRGRDEFGAEAWARHPLAYLVEAADDVCYHVMDFEDGTILGLIDEGTARAQLAALVGKPELGGSRRSISSLRAIAINVVVKQVAEAFCTHEQALLAGEAIGPLIAGIPAAPALDAIRELSVARCYRAEQVLRVELAGYEVLGGLLDFLVPAVLAAPEARSKRQHKLLGLLGLEDEVERSPYQRLLQVTDFLVALTDRSAVRLFRELRGTELAGARGVG
ncbi:Deoxyguanosinetriphosphate triphosphohydrolase [Enhygromyxa salina]|uniref:Deoxyguanosinetriphosphate triphosphohydrolase n=1 Tax=Enhygromyxa salina TaxID=215803 RepID=A0A2S9YIZ4_9BACT|nr:dNTP triphosphohydrolase [Enhygromyxa salina]PRQ05073.1 Deoxyguanosinetriphosphate triphosphohydrolase [Enhygromyxa salina]